MSGLQAAPLLLCFGACRGWVTEGQLKKGSNRWGIVRGLACLLVGGIVCGTARRVITCFLFWWA